MTSIEHKSNIQKELAKIFDLSASELQNKAYIVLIEQKLSQIEGKIFKILNRHEIRDIRQFDEFFRTGKIAESEGWEDFFELDGLISEKKNWKTSKRRSFNKMKPTLEEIRRIFLLELENWIRSTEINRNKLRIILTDSSLIDIYCSFNVKNRWAFHWERNHVDGTMFRHDNIPHKSWIGIGSFPWHYHQRNQNNVVKSNFTDNILLNIQKFIHFIKELLEK